MAKRRTSKKQTAEQKKAASTIRNVLLLILLGVALYQYFNPGNEPGSSADIAPTEGPGELTVMTWNIQNFGGSKTPEELDFIAELIRDSNADIVAVQEVSTGPPGAQAVAAVDDRLDRLGSQWDYVVSEPTSGDGSERYAYLWRPSRARLTGAPFLESSLARPIDREPFMARFERDGKQVLLANFHAVPRGKNPARECEQLVRLHEKYPDEHLMIMGDFNLSERNVAWLDLRQAGFAPIIRDQKTSLKMRRQEGEHLANEYDNIFFETESLQYHNRGVVDFSQSFRTLRQAREISDHIPVYITFSWR